MTPNTPNGGRKAKDMSPTGQTPKGKRQVGLENQTEAWPTPTGTPYGNNQGGANGRVGKKRPSLESMASHSDLPAPPTENPGPESSSSPRTSRPQLNPRFCEWLMGLPIGLTAYASQGTGLTAWLRQQRSLLFGVDFQEAEHE